MSIRRRHQVVAGLTAAAAAVAVFHIAAPASADGVTYWKPPPVCAPHNQGSSPLTGDWTYVSPPVYEYPDIAYNFIYTLEYNPSPMEACYVYVG